MLRGLLTACGNAVLGHSRERRRNVVRMLITAHVYIVSMLLAAWGRSQGLIPQREGGWLMALLGSCVVGFYVLVRLGVHLRASDREMGLERSVLGVTACVLAYAWGGELRTVALLPLSMTLVLGMFSLTQRQLFGVSLGAMAALGAVMTMLVIEHPDRYPAFTELFYFGIVGSCLPTTAVTARQIQQLREKLLRQKTELSETLARVEHLAQRDALTGLFNRAHMLELMTQESEREARGYGCPCSVAIIDIDWFKRINDAFGHPAGDAVLHALGEQLTPLMRRGDVFARWGGEEFVLLMPRTTLEDARRVAQRMRMAAQQAYWVPGAPEHRVTLSIGVAEHLRHESLDTLLERADRALYQAKSGGRNCVVIAPGSSSLPSEEPVSLSGVPL